MKQAYKQLETVVEAGRTLAHNRFNSLNRRHDLTENQARWEFDQEVRLAQEFIGLLSESERKALSDPICAFEELNYLEDSPWGVVTV